MDKEKAPGGARDDYIIEVNEGSADRAAHILGLAPGCIRGTGRYYAIAGRVGVEDAENDAGTGRRSDLYPVIACAPRVDEALIAVRDRIRGDGHRPVSARVLVGGDDIRAIGIVFDPDDAALEIEGCTRAGTICVVRRADAPEAIRAQSGRLMSAKQRDDNPWVAYAVDHSDGGQLGPVMFALDAGPASRAALYSTFRRRLEREGYLS